jgi:peptidoglycan/LPS O-acetylase OafA/YrhL
MRVLKIILIVLVAIALTSAIIHAFFFHGGLFLGLPFLHAGRLLRMLVFATGSVLAFVWGVGVKRPGLRWLKIALLSLGVILAVLAFVNLMGAL